MRTVYRLAIGFSAIIFTAIGFALPAAAAIPGSDNPKAQTQNDYMRGELAFARRMYIDAYKTVGKHDPKWDAAVLKFLEAECKCLVYNDAESLYFKTEPVSLEELSTLAKACTDAGCDDPFILYLRALLVLQLRDQSRPMLEKAIDGMVERKYPPFNIGGASRRLISILNPAVDHADIRKYENLNWGACVDSVVQSVAKEDLRYVYNSVVNRFRQAEPILVTAAFEKMEKSRESDPWLLNALRGRCEVDYAWNYRGSGVASEVTPMGWKLFYESLTKAHDWLIKAQALHPDFPEAATTMIAVAMGAGDKLNETTRGWFDKAVTAQIDYTPAYDAYIWSIYPRWGGDYPEMLAFGLECLASKRFDTSVPMYLMTVLCRTSFPGRYEISAKLQTPDATHPSVPVIFFESDDLQFNCAGFDPVKNIVGARLSGLTMLSPHPQKPNDINEIHIQVTRPYLKVEINGIEADFGRVQTAPRNLFIGIGFDSTTPGGIARFKEIKIRRIAPANPNPPIAPRKK